MNYNNNELVMGWDIGDGDTAAYAMQVLSDKHELVGLNIDANRDDKVIPSVVSKQENGKIIIGYSAGYAENFTVNFKHSPQNWGDKSSEGVPYKQHMSDFIRGVSEAILANSTNRTVLSNFITYKENNAFWNSDKILLVVGCPAADNWKNDANRKAYEELIAKATGIKNVIVAEESRAAIFSLFDKNSKSQEELQKLNYRNGVLVLDFGSSTADASCIVPGEKAVHLSWNLGAAKIENAMLEYIKKSPETTTKLIKAEEKYRKKLFLDLENASKNLLDLRKFKENYYSGVTANTITVDFNLIDTDGDPIYNEFGDRVKFSVSCKIDAEIMNYVTEKYTFKTTKDNKIVCDNTWAKTCEEFMQDVKSKLEIEKIHPNAVVLTGGGSNMPFVWNIAKNVFTKTKVVPSATPSHSVVSGLTVIGFNALKEEEVRKKIIDSVKQSAKNNMDKMLGDISYELASTAYDKAINAIDSMIPSEKNGFLGTIRDVFGNITNWNRNVGDINRTVKNAISGYLNEDNILAVIKKYDITRKNDDIKTITTKINEAAKDLYTDKALQTTVGISENIVSSIAGDSLSIINKAGGGKNINIGRDSNIIGKILSIIVGLILMCVVIVIACFVLPLAPLAAILAACAHEEISDKIMQFSNTPVPLGALRSSLNRMKENKVAEISKIKGDLKTAIKETLTAESALGPDFKKHYDELEKVTNKATDHIFFIV